MLHHSDTGDLVERGVAQCPIVADFDIDAVRESIADDSPPRQSRLLLAERDSRRPNTVVPSRMHRERAPAAADVEQSFSSLEAKLSTHEIELRGLRFVERLDSPLEVRARVHHLAIEPERVEVVPNVIVEANRVGIALLGVLASEPKHPSRDVGALRFWWRFVFRKRQDVAQQTRRRSRGRNALRRDVAEVRRTFDVSLDVDITEEIRLDDGELR